VICGILCCIYIISHSTCCKVSIYNQWIVICGQHVDCVIMYIQQNTPQITIHLLYIDTIQQVDCDIMYIPQNTPQITIHGILCCIYIISQFTCCMVSIYNKWIVICSILAKHDSFAERCKLYPEVIISKCNQTGSLMVENKVVERACLSIDQPFGMFRNILSYVPSLKYSSQRTVKT
jgi:hypothetical protein